MMYDIQPVEWYAETRIAEEHRRANQRRLRHSVAVATRRSYLPTLIDMLRNGLDRAELALGRLNSRNVETEIAPRLVR